MLRIRTMTPEDIEFGMFLKAEAGWNQTEQDWQRFLALRPDGCFLGLWNGRPVGSVTTCVFRSVAWIGMMLVTAEFRQRGIGRALLEHAMDSLDSEIVTSIRLDATPLGRPLYLKLGFCAQFEVIRYGGHPQAQATDFDIRPYDLTDFESINELDRWVVGADRRQLLARLLDDAFSSARVYANAGSIDGYALFRGGSQATQIGPCIAKNEPAGRALLLDALSRLAGKNVYVDVPEQNAASAAVVQSAGLKPLRQLTRMCRGTDSREQVPWLWASSGPEKG